MNIESEIIYKIREKFPKLFITEISDDAFKLSPEQDNGYVEYKRTMALCSEKKAQQYATQMRWRISENIKSQSATYFIGVDDDGTIVGLTDEEILTSVSRFLLIAGTIRASIIGVQIIHINDLSIIKFGVKLKKIRDNYLVEFGDKF